MLFKLDISLKDKIRKKERKAYTLRPFLLFTVIGKTDQGVEKCKMKNRFNHKFIRIL